MKWYIGQRVVRITEHADGVVIKGNIYVIQGIKECGCGITLDVGVRDKISKARLMQCSVCGKIEPYDVIWYLHHSGFAPLDELSDYTVETLLNEIEIVNV